MHINHYTRTLDEFIRRVEQGEPQDARDIAIAREALTELRRRLDRVTYDRALEVVRDFTEGLSGGSPEYERGQLELLADLFGGPEADTEARIERIVGDMRAKVAEESRPVALTAFECNLLRTLHRSRPLAPDIVKTLGGIVARLPYPDPRAASHEPGA